MKIGVFTDVHANLPALIKVISFFRKQGCDHIYHVGDLIGIGPHPKECMEFALSISELTLIMGNHDYWYAYGLPKNMHSDEKKQKKWTHKQLTPQYISVVKTWPFCKSHLLPNGKSIHFSHYGLNKQNNWFVDIVPSPTADDLDNMFSDVKSDYVFYGHHHQASEEFGKKHYINVGSAGCHNKAEARCSILTFKETEHQLKTYSLPYKDGSLLEDYELRNVPSRDFILKVFVVRKNG